MDKSTLETAGKACEALFKATKKASTSVKKMHDQVQKHWDDWETLADEIIGMQGDKKSKGADQDKALTERHKRPEAIRNKIISIQKRMNGEQKAAIDAAEKINQL
ncbi:MAG: hypothetical protein AAFU49_11620 [Pseudomonadota bacterium]